MMRAAVTGTAVVLALGLASPGAVYGQSKGPSTANQQRLAEIREALASKSVAEKGAARNWARKHAIPLRRELPNGRILELQRLGPNGPVFYISNNVDAADSISTDELWPGGSSGLNLDGQGLTVGEWDSGRVLLEHPDLYLRSQQMDENDDPPPAHSDHATHVAGTLIGSGGSQYPQARGMAPAANLQAWDWNNDLVEMADAAAAGLLVSNHSYSIAAGWIPYGQAEPDNWWWIGGAANNEDPNFGYYDSEAQTLDQIANSAPHYLIVKAAGNDRWDIGPNPGETYTIVDQNGAAQGTSTQQRPADCGQTGYDCLPGSVVAKNILTVGAVNDVNGGYLPLQGPASVQLTGFSSFGPTDDGRIKPDLVANGWLLLSTWGAPNYFAVIAGTSMAAPSVSGSLLLLQEHWQNLHGVNQFMRAATLKALAIHSADEAGAANGPDYEYGWGLMNSSRAAEVLSENGNGDHLVVEGSRNDPSPADEVNFTVSEEGARVRVTLVWNDPAATPAAPVLDPSATMLVNDLDLRVVGNGDTHQPWVLNPLSPSAAATRGDNIRDNVEMVEFVASAGSYTAQVSHKSSLQGGSQDYSLIVSVRPPAPVSAGIIIDEDFNDVSLPAGWAIETSAGNSWEFYADGSGELANSTLGTGGYAMVYNTNPAAYTVTSLILPPLDLSSAESVLLRFKGFYYLLDGWEQISVYTSSDGGSNWSFAHGEPINSIVPRAPQVDLTNKIAGAADARISFRFDSVTGIAGYQWQIDDVEVEIYGEGAVGPPPPPLELPGQAEMPSPASGTTAVGTSPTLAWISAPTADSHSIYFGTELSLQGSDFRGNQTDTQFSPGLLANNTTYFWRVDEVNASGTTAGVVWNFTTQGGGGPPPTGPSTVHVADLEASSVPLARNRWQATVRVQVLDDQGDPVSSTAVSGQWSSGANGSDTQNTDNFGWASFSKDNLKAGVGSVTFSVTGLSHASLTYDPTDNSDADGDSDGSSILVPKDAPAPPANTPPTLSILLPGEGQAFLVGAEVPFSANAADAEDGNLDAAISWSSAGQTLASGPVGSHPFDEGVHTVTAAVSDSGGETASQSVTITVGDPPAASSALVDQLEDLSSGDGRRWTAVARITVRDDLGNAVSGATVSGGWSAGAKGGASCVTDPAGRCEVSKGNKTNVATVVFTVTGISASGLGFDSSGPDTIQLQQP